MCVCVCERERERERERGCQEFACVRICYYILYIVCVCAFLCVWPATRGQKIQSFICATKYLKDCVDTKVALWYYLGRPTRVCRKVVLKPCDGYNKQKQIPDSKTLRITLNQILHCVAMKRARLSRWPRKPKMQVLLHIRPRNPQYNFISSRFQFDSGESKLAFIYICEQSLFLQQKMISKSIVHVTCSIGISSPRSNRSEPKQKGSNFYRHK